MNRLLVDMSNESGTFGKRTESEKKISGQIFLQPLKFVFSRILHQLT